jgi:hypothetical protein
MRLICCRGFFHDLGEGWLFCRQFVSLPVRRVLNQSGDHDREAKSHLRVFVKEGILRDSPVGGNQQIFFHEKEGKLQLCSIGVV